MNKPPFCPHSDCSNYHQPEGNWYVKKGVFPSRKQCRVQRYLCRSCGKGFSDATFSLNYYTKLKIPYRVIVQQLATGSGNRDLSRLFRVSCSTISNRISRLARQSLAANAELSSELELKEDLVADGFESFVKSQYMPNNINILAGKDSQFWILSDYAHLTRKGQMTEYQRKRNEELKEKIKINRVTVYESFQNLVKTALRFQASSSRDSVTLYTDEHPQYKRVMALLSDEERRVLKHVQVSSRKARTVNNPLFSVNYLDREIRKDNSDHVRETVQFARNAANAMDRLAIYRLYHNFLKPFRINGAETGPLVTHGGKAGISEESIRREMKTLFTQRRFLGKQGMMNISDRKIWCRCLSTPLNRFADAVPGYVKA